MRKLEDDLSEKTELISDLEEDLNKEKSTVHQLQS